MQVPSIVRLNSLWGTHSADYDHIAPTFNLDVNLLQRTLNLLALEEPARKLASVMKLALN
jgi:hypothetical protein